MGEAATFDSQATGGWPGRNYFRTALIHDLAAGLTVAALDVPQAMAYALIAGIRPEYGLYSAIIPPLIASLVGSSSHLIGGPTNALSLLVFSAVAGISAGPDDPLRIQLVVLLAALVGIIQILIALLKLGDLTRYISESVIVGFLPGAAILIVLGQIPNFLGLPGHGDSAHSSIYNLWTSLTSENAISGRAVGIGVMTAVAALALRRYNNHFRFTIPDKLIGLTLASLAVWWFHWGQLESGAGGVEVIGHVPGQLPPFALPPIGRGDLIRQLYLSPIAIALLGLVESLTIAKAIAVRTGQRLDFNRQCLADGLANVGGSMFHCMPASGSLTRSAINYQSGAATRMAGIFSALAVAVVLLLFAPLAQYVPKSALAAILIVTAWRLVDRRRIEYCLRASRFDASIAIATALSAVFIGIEFSILIGIFLSFMFLVPRAARLHGSEQVISPEKIIRQRRPDDPECTKMVLFSLEGEMFFGAAPELEEHLQELTRRVEQGARVVILRLKRARNPDMVCMEKMQHFLIDMNRRGVIVLLSGVRPDFAKALRNLQFHHWLPPDRIFMEEATRGSATLRAVRKAYEILGNDHCPTCPRLVPPDGQGEWHYVI